MPNRALELSPICAKPAAKTFVAEFYFVENCLAEN